MNFGTSRASAIENLNRFVDQNLFEYSRLRNFDYGPDNRSNISCLSPYITHGVISELEVIKKSLSKFSFFKNEKFIQEVLWRTYWKGWLELRPNVWTDYLNELKKVREEFKDNQNYKDAIEGNTNIECFNEWIKELKETNYLHNHARMWFASIWIFTLDLPWQLGAEFFMKHLYDGDAASNTLGWRWVAGIQTQGKNYLASEWNIKKFTNNRFSNIKLNENAPPKVFEKTYTIIKQDFNNPQNIEDKNLLIFENNLSFEITDFQNNKFKKIYLISNKNENRSLKLSEKVVKFKSLLIEDQEQRLKAKSIDCKVIDINEIKKIENCYALYPTVGENLDYLNLNNIKIDFLYRKLDQYSWQYCNKGFFNFKNYIPKIISLLKVSS
ncbi:MAG: FAD-binding domain-containing protein [Candidatus Pelagibacter sp.]|nr:DNA photolyase [Pelagibacterales bacterium SAG-MED12]